MEGQHIIIDAFYCDTAYLNDITYLETLCNEAALNTDMEVLFTYFHQFEPQGVTGMLVLSTSHISIHTWPEEGYASLDFYTCGEHDLDSQVEFLLQGLSSSNAMVYKFSRGVAYPQIIQCNHIHSDDTSTENNLDEQQE